MEHSAKHAVTDWIRGILASRRMSHELDDASEARRVAHDLKMSVWELRALAAKGPDSAKLLDERMHDLDLDETDLARAGASVERDLQRTCAMCNQHRRCAHDLRQHDRSGSWTDYCPNASTLQAMQDDRLEQV